MKKILLGIAIILTWLAAFPLRTPATWVDVATGAALLTAAIVGFVLLSRLHLPVLEIGWLVLTYSLLLDLLDEFTREPDFWNSIVPGILDLTSLVLIAIGLYTAQQKIRREQARQRTLAEIEHAIALKTNLTERLNLLLDRTLSYLRVDIGTVSLCEELPAQPLRILSARGARAPERWAQITLPLGQGAMGWVAEQGKPLALADVRADARWIPLAITDAEEIVSYLGVPLRIEERVIGVLDVATRTPRTFTPDEIEFMTTLAAHTAAAIHNARLLEQARHNARFATLLNSISHASLAATDLRAMAQTLADRLGELFDADGCFITQWDEERQIPIHLAAYGAQRETYPQRQARPGVSMTQSVLQAGHALVAEDVFHSPYTNPKVAEQYATRSMLGLPLIAGAEKLGAALISYHQPHQFTPEEITRGEQAAAQIALAFTRVRLLDETKRHATQLATLNEIGRAVSSLVSVPDTLETIYRQVQRILPLDCFFVCLYDAATDRVSYPLMYDSGVRYVETPGPAPHHLLLGQVIDSGTAALRNRSTAEIAQTVSHSALGDTTRVSASLLFAPLKSGDHCFGAISTQSYTPSAYNAEHLDLLIGIAHQAAIALENARLFEAERAQLLLAQTLQEIGKLLTAEMSLAQVLEQILDLLGRVIPYDSASVQLQTEDGSLELVAGRGFANWERARQIVHAVGAHTLTVKFADPTSAIVIPDTAADSRWIAVPGSEHIQAWIGAPLLVHGRLIGVLNIDSCTAHTYTPATGEPAMAFAAQAAIAIENARLFEAAQQHTAELEAVRQATLGLTARLELPAVLEAILQNALRLSQHARNAHIFIIARDTEQLTFGAALWSDGRRDIVAPPRPNGLTYTVARTGETIIVPDIRNHPLFAKTPPEWSGAIVGLPLKIEQRVVGVMNIAYRQAQDLSDNQLRALRLLGDQAALAIENARLFQTSTRQTEQLTMLNTAAIQIQQLLEPSTILQTACDKLRHFGSFASAFQIEPHCLRHVYTAMDTPMLNRYITRFGKLQVDFTVPLPAVGDEWQALQAGTTLCADVLPRLIPAASPTVRPVLTWLRGECRANAPVLTPLMRAGKLFGVLAILGEQVRPSDIPLVAVFARQVSAALENARLVEELQAALTLTTHVYQLSAEILNATTLDETTRLVLASIRDGLHADAGVIDLYDADGNSIYYASLGMPENYRHQAKPRPGGLTARARAAQTPIIVQDPAQLHPQLAALGFQNSLAVPLPGETGNLGVMFVSYRQQHAFLPHEVELLSLFANQAALALRRVRLLEETQHRARESELLYTTTQDLAEQGEVNTLLKRIAARAISLVGGNGGAIYLYDPVHSDLELVIAQNFGIPVGAHLPVGEGLTGRVAQTRRAIVLDDYSAWEHRHADSRHVPFRSVVSVPLMTSGQLIGVLTISEIGESTRKFTEHDAKRLSLFAVQAAAIVQNARSLAEARRRADQLAVLNRIAGLVNQTFKLDSLLEVVYHEVMSAIKPDTITIGLYDAATKEMDYRIREDRGKREPPMRVHLTEGLAYDVIRTQKPLLKQWAEIRTRLASVQLWGTHEPAKTWLGAPMRVGNLIVGMLAIGSYQTNAFSPDDERLVSIIAEQMAAAIDKTQLFEDAQQRALEQSTLSAIARALNATLDPHDALPTITTGVQLLTGCQHMQLALFDQSTHTATILAPAHTPQVTFALADTASTPDLVAGQPHLTPDLAQECDLPADRQLFDAGWRARLDLPLSSGDQVIGMLRLASRAAHSLNTQQLPVLTQIAGTIAIALTNARLYEAERTRRAELSALYELSRDLADATNFEPILNLVARYAVETIPATFARVALVEDTDFVIRAGYPTDPQLDLGIGAREPIRAHPFCEGVLAQTEHVIVHRGDPGVNTGNCDGLFLNLAQTLFLLPLHIGTHNIGLLMIGERRRIEREPFTPEKIRLARNIADQAAGALRRAELFAELEKAYLQTVLALANAVDAKDSDTNIHSQRLTHLTLAIGSQLGLDQTMLEDLRYGAILHDIGKIGVPDAVLNKAGALTEDEWMRMRQHPVTGAQILAPLPRLNGAAKIVRHHHEWYNGAGYPDHLAGEQIPIGARILTIVDAYGAILDRRVYKQARTPAEAIAEIKRCAGTQFDPHIIKIFLSVLGTETAGEPNV